MEESYYSRNRERCLQKAKEYIATHKDHYKQKSSEYWRNNKERLTAKKRQQYIPKPRIKKAQSAPPELVLPIFPVSEPISTIEYTNHDFIVKFE